MSNDELLLQRIESRTACIAVIGMGYVGLPLAVEFALQGFSVVAIDSDPGRVEKVNQGLNY
ncbi:UDP-N-acetyl-D-glucosamine dehydrogenase, partial [Candidatus Bipolaricaulota bacterium]|nr:UDP-N-acetyl-D-glucosamine dehydrogenase [Candidatus Bipolaricaulota bacterium]